MQKRMICLLILCVVLPVTAIAEGKVTFEWTPQGDNAIIAGYMLFCREEGKYYDYNAPIWEGDSTFSQCTISDLEPSKTYYFVMRSVDIDDNQSDDSAEVEYSLNTPPPNNPPDAPPSDPPSVPPSDGNDAGLGGDGVISTSTSFSSCFLQSLGPTQK